MIPEEFLQDAFKRASGKVPQEDLIQLNEVCAKILSAESLEGMTTDISLYVPDLAVWLLELKQRRNQDVKFSITNFLESLFKSTPGLAVIDPGYRDRAEELTWPPPTDSEYVFVDRHDSSYNPYTPEQGGVYGDGIVVGSGGGKTGAQKTNVVQFDPSRKIKKGDHPGGL